MIYVKRDPEKIPEKLLELAEKAQQELEGLPQAERVAFIKKKSRIWRAFKKCLAGMSYDKCWYSEMKPVQAFFDVDHFRPKSEAERSDGVTDDGYPWLAFSWDNFRYSAPRSNQLSKDEETDQTKGKSSWFPLAKDSPVACWEDRCIDKEMPILLDPINGQDMKLIQVGAGGLIESSRICKGLDKKRVDATVDCYGLNLPKLRDARLEVMRQVSEMIDTLIDDADVGDKFVDDDAVKLNLVRKSNTVTERALPKSEYSLAARAVLSAKFPELLPDQADYAVWEY